MFKRKVENIGWDAGEEVPIQRRASQEIIWPTLNVTLVNSLHDLNQTVPVMVHNILSPREKNWQTYNIPHTAYFYLFPEKYSCWKYGYFQCLKINKFDISWFLLSWVDRVAMKSMYTISEIMPDKNTSANNRLASISNPGFCPTGTYKAQKIRWLMLIIFICFTFINSVQWGQYVIISNLIQKFYDVSGSSVDNTTIVFMVAYIPLIFPALWLLEKMVSTFDFWYFYHFIQSIRWYN